jgi:hypothetical protein
MLRPPVPPLSARPATAVERPVAVSPGLRALPGRGRRASAARSPAAAPLTRFFPSSPPAGAEAGPAGFGNTGSLFPAVVAEAPERRVRRAKRWAGLRLARRISSHKPEQLRKCRKVSRLPRGGVGLRMSGQAPFALTGYAGYVTCGSWSRCPCCAAPGGIEPAFSAWEDMRRGTHGLS